MCSVYVCSSFDIMSEYAIFMCLIIYTVTSMLYYIQMDGFKPENAKMYRNKPKIKLET